MNNIKFSIVITTKNRLKDLKFTLQSVNNLYSRDDVELLVCDDASTDGTQQFLKENFKTQTLIFNTKSRGLIHNRNLLNSKAKGKYIISIDDDLDFLSKNVLQHIENHFKANKNCAVLSFRVFWSKQLPKSSITTDSAMRVKSFLGGAHVWRKEVWDKLPNYPAWFMFYGEEDFASYQVFKKGYEIHYIPEVLAHHRVDLKARQKNKDYYLRQRRSLRSGWYLYGLFYPKRVIPKQFLYSVYSQIKNKVANGGDVKVLGSIMWAILDVIKNIPKIISQSNRLTLSEYKAYKQLPNTKIYWKPENE